MKKKILFRTLSYSVLVLPMFIFLILSATIFNVKVKHFLVVNDESLVDVYEVEDGELFVTTSEKEVLFVGVISYREDYDSFGFYIGEGDVVKVNNKYFAGFVEESGEMVLQKFSPYKLNKKENGWKIPTTLIFSVVGLVFVGLIFSGKLKFSRRYMKASILISLGIGVGVSALINALVNQIYLVFLISFISFALYLIVEKIYYLTEKEEGKMKKKSETLKYLDDILKHL